MEMCYDGALVMPSNYAVMDADEMMYVEGGKFSWKAAQGVVISALGWLVCSIVKKAVKDSLIGALMTSVSAWVTNVINSTIMAVMWYPDKVAALAYGLVALGCVTYSIYQAGRRKKYW